MSEPGVRTLERANSLALITLLVACDAGEKPAPPATPPLPSVDVVRDDHLEIAYLPPSSDIVIRVDVAALRKTKLWATYKQDLSALLVPGFFPCAYDPIDTTTSVLIGISLQQEPVSPVFVVRGADKQRALECLRGTRAAKMHGEYVTVTRPTGGTAEVAFFDRPEPWMTKVKEDFTKSPQLSRMLAKLYVSAPVAMATRPGSKAVEDKTSASGMKAQEMYGTLTVADGLRLSYTTAFRTADEATQLAALMNDQMKSLKSMMDAKATAQDNSATIEIAMTEPQATSLINMLKPMLPAQQAPAQAPASD